MNIKELLKEYGKQYNYLYDHYNDDLVNIIEADYADIFFSADDPDFIETARAAARERGDGFTSDREGAAFVLAYKIVERREAYKQLQKYINGKTA
jgi:hypothetical protein